MMTWNYYKCQLNDKTWVLLNSKPKLTGAGYFCGGPDHYEITSEDTMILAIFNPDNSEESGVLTHPWHAKGKSISGNGSIECIKSRSKEDAFRKMKESIANKTKRKVKGKKK